MENINITAILQALVTIIAAVVSAFVIPWVRQKIGAGNMAEFLRWVEIAVTAAEQLYDSTDGAAKKRHVLEFLQDKGYTVDAEELDNAIEAAVRKLHNELYGSNRAEVTANGAGN